MQSTHLVLDSRAPRRVFGALRRSTDAVALAAAAFIGLLIGSFLVGDLEPHVSRSLLAAHLVFWLAGLAFLRWLAPSGTLHLGRLLSGLTMGLPAGVAAVLLLAAALSRGVPTVSDMISLVATVPSLVLSLGLAGPAVIIARRLLPPAQLEEPAENPAARRQEEALSIVFHELRRPLATLVSASEMAMEPNMPDEERTYLLASVHRQALRLNDFLEEILEAARIQSGSLRLNLRAMDVRSLVADTCAEFDDTCTTHDIRYLPDRRPLPVAADPAKLRMVLSNLMANAIKYSPPGSTVTVKVYRDQSAIVIQVDDEGPGVPEAYRQKIFEEFFRIPGTSERGFGLGLYIARKLVQAHRGAIWVEGREPRGSRFIVSLPARERRSEKPNVQTKRGGFGPISFPQRPARLGRKG